MSVGRALLGLLPGVLAALAEGAWISIVAALVASAVHEDASLLIGGAVVAALVGLGLARRLGGRPDWPSLTVWLTFGAAVVGWLADGATLAALGRLDIPAAVGSHPAGWLAGLAFLRGSAHGNAASSEGAMETLIRIALPALALPILVAGVLAEPWHGRFLDAARPAVVLFLGAATIGVGVARLAALRGTAGFDWRGNRAWLALLVLLVVAVSLLALPIASVVGPVVQVLITVLFVPVLLLGTIAGFRHVTRWVILAYAAFWFVLVAVLAAVNNSPKPETGDAGAGTIAPQVETTSMTVFAILGVVVLVLIAVGILVLARLWSRDVLARPGGDVPEERWIDTSEPVITGPRRGRRGLFGRRRPSPTTAEEAYLAALGVLERSPETRRAPGESPAEHAARVRTMGRHGAEGGAAHLPPPGLALDLLAADYQLSRFGGLELTA
ncbi:MAG TPA: hypothetical protein VFS32_04155, partial [Candidatus Limnocylindrales bacterium]|nr:hypothetical protein [Candidatus Limnocylindrales bacterium]